MKKPAALPLFGDSYLADTTHLTTEEHGAYLLLMLAAWRNADCALPGDDRTLARITRLSTRRWNALKPTLLAFWTLDASTGRLFQRRLRQEFAYVLDKSQGAKAAAEARWGRDGQSFGQVDAQKSNTSLQHGDERTDAQGIENAQCGRCEGICVCNAPPPPPPPHIMEEEDEGGSGDLFGGELPEEPPPDPVLIVLEAWNAMARGAGLRTVVKLTDQRRKRLLARIKDYTVDTMTEAIAAVPSRPFLMGQGPRGWKADFDFITRPDSVAKIMEGNYGERAGKRSGWSRSNH
jgi:uncharacterized protein YdaU (DUF1376 family)